MESRGSERRNITQALAKKSLNSNSTCRSDQWVDFPTQEFTMLLGPFEGSSEFIKGTVKLI